MNKFPEKLLKKLLDRKENNSFRELPISETLVDFSSNDYLGFSNSEEIYNGASEILEKKRLIKNGATGSRLLSGNYSLYDDVETYLSDFHEAESALIFNSGYDANIGFFSSVPQRGDIILYDELIHASIRDGIKMSNAKAYKFKHNDLNDLISHIERNQDLGENKRTEIYMVSESVFSMDGDSPNLEKLVDISKEYSCRLIIDEAHALGVFGKNGCGLLQELNLHKSVFARIITFGKALGCHGAAILGSNELKDYLVNFARSFIYTTALPPHSVATILSAYEYLKVNVSTTKLQGNITHFNSQLIVHKLESNFIQSKSAIHCCILPGNQEVKNIALKLQEGGFDIKPVLSPTVPEGKERLRICLHSYNSTKEITDVLKFLANFVNN